jgi:hypothetical protein
MSNVETEGRARWRFNVGTLDPTQQSRLLWLIRAVLALNVLDAAFTLVWVRAGRAQEANVLMRALVNDHPVWFVTVKLALVSLGSFLLWRWRHRTAAVIGIFIAFLAYYFVLLYHLHFYALLLSAR